MKRILFTAAVAAYELIGWGTFVKLVFFDGYRYTAWNWIIAVPIDAFLGQIWPIYWAILRPLFGK